MIKKAPQSKVIKFSPDQMKPLELPLPPSVNHAFLTTGTGMRINSPFTQVWYRTAILLTRNYMQRYNLKPFDSWVYCDMEFFLGRRGSDSHNYIKIYDDALEKAGIVVNDSLILNRIQSVDFDSKNPRVLAKFTLKN